MQEDESGCFFWKQCTIVDVVGPCPHVVHPVVISQKLSKIDPELLWKTVRKLALLILLPHSWSAPDSPLGRPSSFKYKICADTSKPSSTVELLSVWSTVVNTVKHLDLIVTISVCWRCRTGGGPTSVCSAKSLFIMNNWLVMHWFSCQTVGAIAVPRNTASAFLKLSEDAVGVD